MKKISLDRGNKPVKALQLAHGRAIAHWINAECPTVTYQSVNIEANSMVVPDISQISELQSEDYDLVLCSLPLLYERAKEPLANELIRILKADGLCLLSTALSVTIEMISSILFWVFVRIYSTACPIKASFEYESCSNLCKTHPLRVRL